MADDTDASTNRCAQFMRKWPDPGTSAKSKNQIQSMR